LLSKDARSPKYRITPLPNATELAQRLWEEAGGGRELTLTARCGDETTEAAMSREDLEIMLVKVYVEVTGQ
jgi:hypothetical protein